jgi:hypothetical protein
VPANELIIDSFARANAPTGEAVPTLPFLAVQWAGAVMKSPRCRKIAA